MIEAVMRFLLVVTLFLSACASPPSDFSPLDGIWRGPQMLVLKGYGYEVPGQVGRFTTDAHKFYFSPNGSSATTAQLGAIECPYTLAGDVLTLRDCRYAGQYHR
jgi:hypothetical protein